MRNRLSRSSGSAARRSSESSSVTWRSSSAWLRRARFLNTSLMPRRTFASSTAASTAVRCAVLNAALTWPISSGLGCRDGTCVATSTVSPARSRRTTSGSRTLAISRAESRSPRS